MNGFEHVEESASCTGATDVEFRSDAYGEADSIELDIGNLVDAAIVIDGAIDSFAKVDDPLQRNSFVHAPTFRFEISGTVLLVHEARTT